MLGRFNDHTIACCHCSNQGNEVQVERKIPGAHDQAYAFGLVVDPGRRAQERCSYPDIARSHPGRKVPDRMPDLAVYTDSFRNIHFMRRFSKISGHSLPDCFAVLQHGIVQALQFGNALPGRASGHDELLLLLALEKFCYQFGRYRFGPG